MPYQRQARHRAGGPCNSTGRRETPPRLTEVIGPLECGACDCVGLGGHGIPSLAAVLLCSGCQVRLLRLMVMVMFVGVVLLKLKLTDATHQTSARGSSILHRLPLPLRCDEAKKNSSSCMCGPAN